jgi:hypothetical protein
MLRLIRTTVLPLVLVALVALMVFWGTLHAARQVRPFYQRALASDPVILRQGSRELQSQVGAFYSDAQQSGDWSAVFTDAQLNGWLATELATTYAEKLPPNIRDPRIAISPHSFSLGFHRRQVGIDTIVSVDADLFLTDRGELAARLTSVHAGALPLPAAKVAEEIQKVSERWSLPLRWSQVDGDVVALVDIAAAVSTGEQAVVIDTLELREGELFIAGKTVEYSTPRQALPVAQRSDTVQSEDHSSRQ